MGSAGEQEANASAVMGRVCLVGAGGLGAGGGSSELRGSRLRVFLKGAR